MDMASIKASVNSALETAGTSLKNAGASIKEYGVWFGHKVSVLWGKFSEGVVSYSKAAWAHIHTFGCATFKAATPYANKAMAFISSPIGIFAGCVIAAISFASYGSNEILPDRKVQTYVCKALSLVAAVAAGVFAAQAGIIPVLI